LLFLAMIHGGMGHANEARRLLNQTDEWIAEADRPPSGTEQKGQRWMNLSERPTILVLRREAEAVVRFDPVFSADPFARKGRVDPGSTDKPCRNGAG
jgi:hypothetical protein